MKSPFIHLIVWGGLLFVALSAYGYWYSAISNKSVTVAELGKRIGANTEAAGRIATARATLSEIASDEATIASYFVSETEVVSFIDDLEARAKAQSASLKVVSVSAVPKQPLLTFSLAVEGKFDAVMRTVGAIEYAPYDLAVSKFAMSDNGEGLWHADITLTVGSVANATATSTRQAQPAATTTP